MIGTLLFWDLEHFIQNVWGVKIHTSSKSQNFVDISGTQNPMLVKFWGFDFFYLERQSYIDSTVFSIWKSKSLQVLQKACIKIVAHAIYTYLFFFLYIHSPVLMQNKKFLCRPSQIACTVTTMNVNIHTSNVMHTWKSVHSIGFSMLKCSSFFALCLDGFIMYYFLWGLWIVKTVNC